MTELQNIPYLENRINDLNREVRKIILFPGSVQEYEKFKGYEVEIYDTGKSNKGLVYEDLISFKDVHVSDLERLEQIEKLIENGVEALVNINFKVIGGGQWSPNGTICAGGGNYYGLPVRKKNKRND